MCAPSSFEPTPKGLGRLGKKAFWTPKLSKLSENQQIVKENDRLLRCIVMFLGKSYMWCVYVYI